MGIKDVTLSENIHTITAAIENKKENFDTENKMREDLLKKISDLVQETPAEDDDEEAGAYVKIRYDIDDLLDGDYDSYLATGYTLYYFGSDEDTDGAMKTGAVSATIDGDSYNFFFRKSGGTEKRGAGVNGIDDNKYIYKAGLRIKAGSDDKYKVVEVVNTVNAAGTLDINTNDYISVKKLSGSAVRRQNTPGTPFVNNDDDTVNYYKLNGKNYRLVNSTGSVVKNKSGIKDGDDWYFFVNNYDVKLYASEKNVEKTKNAAGKTVNSVLVNWKNDFAH